MHANLYNYLSTVLQFQSYTHHIEDDSNLDKRGTNPQN